MSGIFFVLAIISGSVALGGFVWSVAVGLHSRGRAALEAENRQGVSQPAADGNAGVDGAAPPPVDANRADHQIGFSLAVVGRQVRREGWRRALPGLLAAGGVLALLAFGALALFTSLPSKLFGLIALGAAACILISELRSFSDALRN
jgi:hypothetical protein